MGISCQDGRLVDRTPKEGAKIGSKTETATLVECGLQTGKS